MSGLNRTEVLAQVRLELKDVATIWTDPQLKAYVDRVVKDISQKVPYDQKTALPIIEDTYDIDISGLSSLVRIQEVETPPNNQPSDYRNYNIIYNMLRLKLDSLPSISEDTLTGTLTFTDTNKTISGAGTAFDTEVEAGDFIMRSTETTWYEVDEVVSDTELTLKTAYSGTTGDDALDSSVIRDKNSIAYIYWGKLHTVDDDSSTLPAEYDNLLLEGTLAYASMSESIKVTNQVNVSEDTMAKYLRMGQQRLALYRDALKGIGPITIGRTHPRD